MLSRSQRKNLLLALVFGLMVMVGAAYLVLTYSPSSVDKLFGFLGQVPVVKYLPAVQDRQSAEFIIIDDQSESFDLKINSPERARELASQLELPAGKTQVRLVLVDEELNHKFADVDAAGNEWGYMSLGYPLGAGQNPQQIELHLKLNPEAFEALGWERQQLMQIIETHIYRELLNYQLINQETPTDLADTQNQRKSTLDQARSIYSYLYLLDEKDLFHISW